MASNSKNNSEGRTLGFLILSSFIHTGLVLAAFAISVESRKMLEVTEVEFLDSKSDTAVATAPAPAPAHVLKSSQPVISKTLPMAAPKMAVSAPQAEQLQAESPVVIPVLETADLSVDTQPTSEPTADLNEEDIATDLDKVDQEQDAKTAAVQEQLSKETEKELEEQNQKLAALQREAHEESEKLAAENAEKRAQERAELEAAKTAAAVGNSSGSGTDQVRALEDLKQVAGNKRPMYDAEDRLKGRQGEVAFMAYVSKQGAITQFKMIKSSGHRQLDVKTLKAIRDWKFYPGQEGWVEIPFKWDLKGGPQEMPATLRRAKISSSN